MKSSVLKLSVLFLCLSLPALAQNKDYSEDVAGGGPTVTLMSGNTRVVVNSFGRSDDFRVDGPDQLFETFWRLAPGGDEAAVVTVGSPACTIVEPIALVNPPAQDHATSQIRCGNCVLELDQFVEGAGSAGVWITTFRIIDCPGGVGCWYHYTDYDVFGDLNNRGTAQDLSAEGDLVLFTVWNVGQPSVRFFARPHQRIGSWKQGQWPSVRTEILGISACRGIGLTNPTEFGPGDWTGADRGCHVPDGGSFCGTLGRDDTLIGALQRCPPPEEE